MALPRGIRNNNPLNIRKGNDWKGERHPQSDRQFEEFLTLELGIRAALVLVRNYMSGYNGKTPKFNTIAKIIRRWAPPTENATDRYINFVADAVSTPKDLPLSFGNRALICDILRAMAFVECGQWIDPVYFQNAYDLL